MKIISFILFLLCTPLLLHSADDTSPDKKKPNLTVAIPLSFLDEKGFLHVQNFQDPSTIKPQKILHTAKIRPHDLEKPKSHGRFNFVYEEHLSGLSIHSIAQTQAARTAPADRLSSIQGTSSKYELQAPFRTYGSSLKTHPIKPFTLAQAAPPTIPAAGGPSSSKSDEDDYLWISPTGEIQSLRLTPQPSRLVSLLKEIANSWSQPGSSLDEMASPPKSLE